MQLYDQIIDEAEELAYNNALPSYPSHKAITDAISAVVGIQLAYNSTAANLAEAAFNRVHFANLSVEGKVKV